MYCSTKDRITIELSKTDCWTITLMTIASQKTLSHLNGKVMLSHTTRQCAKAVVFVPKQRVQLCWQKQRKSDVGAHGVAISLPHSAHDGRAYLLELLFISLKGVRALRVHSLALCGNQHFGLALPVQRYVFQTRDCAFPLSETLLLDLSGPSI